MRIRVFAAVSAAVIVVVLLVVLADKGPKLASSNSRVIQSAASVPVEAGSGRCQGGEYVPGDAGRLRLYPGGPTETGPPLTVTLFDRKLRLVSRTSVPGGYPVATGGDSTAGPLDVALPPGRPTVELGHLCIHNEGAGAVSFAGNLRTANPAAPGASNGPGQRPVDEIRADYFLPDERSALELAPRIVERAALFRPGFMGPWTIWLVLALFVAACAAAAVWFVRHLEAQR